MFAGWAIMLAIAVFWAALFAGAVWAFRSVGASARTPDEFAREMFDAVLTRGDITEAEYRATLAGRTR